jgi:hypothetical protein
LIRKTRSAIVLDKRASFAVEITWFANILLRIKTIRTIGETL